MFLKGKVTISKLLSIVNSLTVSKRSDYHKSGTFFSKLSSALFPTNSFTSSMTTPTFLVFLSLFLSLLHPFLLFCSLTWALFHLTFFTMYFLIFSTSLQTEYLLFSYLKNLHSSQPFPTYCPAPILSPASYSTQVFLIKTSIDALSMAWLLDGQL